MLENDSFAKLIRVNRTGIFLGILGIIVIVGAFHGAKLISLFVMLVTSSLFLLIVKQGKAVTEPFDRPDFSATFGIRPIVLAIVSMVSLSLVILYLDLVNTPHALPAILFVALVSIIDSIAAFSLSSLRNDRMSLVLIIIAFLASNLIVAITPPFGVFGYDASSELFSTKMTLLSGYPMNSSIATPEDLYVNQYPMLSVFGAEFSRVTSMNLISTARFLPIVFNAMSIILLYLTLKLLFKKGYVAGIGTFGYAIFANDIYNSEYVNQSIAMPLALGCFYATVCASNGKSSKYTALSFILAISTVLSHSFTPIVLLSLFLSFFIAKWILGFFPTWKNELKDRTQNLGPQSIRFLIAYVLLIAVFWAYIAIIFFQHLGQLATNVILFNLNLHLVTGATTLAADTSFASTVSFIDVALAALFTAVTIYYVLSCKKENFIAISLLTFVFLMAAVSAISVLIPQISPLPWERASIYIMPIVFGMSFLFLGGSKLMSKRAIVFAILVIFVGIGIFSIPPDYYDRSLLTNPSYTQSRLYFYPQEGFAVSWVNQTGTAVGDDNINELINGFNTKLIFATNNNNIKIFSGNITSISNANFIFVSQNLFYAPSYRVSTGLSSLPLIPRLNQTSLGTINRSPILAKVYDNGYTSIYSPSA